MNFRNALLFSLLGMFTLSLPAQHLEWVYPYTGEGATLPIGTTADDWATAVIVDHDGNLLTAGQLAGWADVDFMETEAYPAIPDQLSMYLCKYTPEGELLWANPVFSAMSPADYRPKLAVDAENNVYYINNFYEQTDIDPGPDEVLLSPAGDADAMLVKYNADGGFEWVVQLGSFEDERIDGLAIDADGNVIVSGQLAEPIDFDPGPGEALEVPTEIALTPFLAKYSPDGAYLWSGLLQITEEVDDFSYALPYGLDTDAENNIYLAGALLGEMDADLSADTFPIGYTAPGADLFLAKYDPNGALQWGFALNGLTLDYLTDLRADQQGHVYLTGFISEGQTDFDPGPEEYLLTVATGEASFLAKYTEAGELVWAFKLGGTNYSRGNTIDFDPEGNIVLAGQMNFSMDVDPSPDVVLLSPASKSGYICTYSPDMEYLSSMVIDGNAESNVFAAAAGPEGQYYAAGFFRKTADFDPGPNTCVLHAENNPINQSIWADGFLAKYTPWCIPADPFTFSKDSLKLCVGDTLVINIPDSLDLHNSCCWLLYEGACGSNAVDSAKYGSLQAQVFESGYYYVGAGGSCPGQQLCDSVYVKVAGDSVYVLPPLTICPGDSVLIFGEYQSESGVYETLLTSSAGCDSLVQQELLIHTFVAGLIALGDSLIANPGDSYQWIDCASGLAIPGATGQSFTPTISGAYSVAITSSGCTYLSDCLSIEVVVSDKNLPGKAWMVYPNPTLGPVHIYLGENHAPITWTLWNAQGQFLQTGTFYKRDNQLDLSALPGGVYWLKLEKSEGPKLFRLIHL